MGVDTYCLVTSDQAKNYIGERAEADALWVYCSASDATAATVTVNDLTMALVITGGTSAGTTTITFATGATDTLTEAVSTINAAAGWKAGVLYYGDSPSGNLVVTGTLSCLGAANEITFKTERTYETDALADRATDIIERWMGRKLYTRTYDRQVYDGIPDRRLVLEQYPITRLGRVSLGRTNAFYVTNTSALNFATIEVDKTTVKLVADGVTTSKTISDSATINALIAIIGGVSGWSATLIGGGTRAAYYTSLDGTTKVPEIIQMPAQYCKSPNLAYVEIPNSEAEGIYLETSAADEDRNTGVIYNPAGWSEYNQSIFIDYIAGYTTIPAALEDLCLELVKMKYNRLKKDASIKSESIGGIYSYSNADLKAVQEDILEAASFYRRILI